MSSTRSIAIPLLCILLYITLAAGASVSMPALRRSHDAMLLTEKASAAAVHSGSMPSSHFEDDASVESADVDDYDLTKLQVFRRVTSWDLAVTSGMDIIPYLQEVNSTRFGAHHHRSKRSHQAKNANSTTIGADSIPAFRRVVSWDLVVSKNLDIMSFVTNNTKTNTRATRKSTHKDVSLRVFRRDSTQPLSPTDPAAVAASAGEAEVFSMIASDSDLLQATISEIAELIDVARNNSHNSHKDSSIAHSTTYGDCTKLHLKVAPTTADVDEVTPDFFVDIDKDIVEAEIDEFSRQAEIEAVYAALSALEATSDDNNLNDDDIEIIEQNEMVDNDVEDDIDVIEMNAAMAGVIDVSSMVGIESEVEDANDDLDVMPEEQIDYDAIAGSIQEAETEAIADIDIVANVENVENADNADNEIFALVQGETIKEPATESATESAADEPTVEAHDVQSMIDAHMSFDLNMDLHAGDNDSDSDSDSDSDVIDTPLPCRNHVDAIPLEDIVSKPTLTDECLMCVLGMACVFLLATSAVSASNSAVQQQIELVFGNVPSVTATPKLPPVTVRSCNTNNDGLAIKKEKTVKAKVVVKPSTAPVSKTVQSSTPSIAVVEKAAVATPEPAIPMAAPAPTVRHSKRKAPKATKPKRVVEPKTSHPAAPTVASVAVDSIAVANKDGVVVAEKQEAVVTAATVAPPAAPFVAATAAATDVVDSIVRDATRDDIVAPIGDEHDDQPQVHVRPDAITPITHCDIVASRPQPSFGEDVTTAAITEDEDDVPEDEYEDLGASDDDDEEEEKEKEESDVVHCKDDWVFA